MSRSRIASPIDDATCDRIAANFAWGGVDCSTRRRATVLERATRGAKHRLSPPSRTLDDVERLDSRRRDVWRARVRGDTSSWSTRRDAGTRIKGRVVAYAALGVLRHFDLHNHVLVCGVPLLCVSLRSDDGARPSSQSRDGSAVVDAYHRGGVSRTNVIRGCED